ncbi:MAG: glycoside hydrolase family 10 protein [Candidatus Neomarinimicrobiota bacterium]
MATFFVSLTGVLGDELEPLLIKGLWIVRESMVDQEEIEAALTFARESGFNHVFVQVRGRGDAYYNSLLVPKSPLVRDSRFDPLAYAVTRGHELGLNVHAWVTTYLLWSARVPPEAGNHIYRMHAEWLEVDAMGDAHVDIDLGAPRNSSFEGIFLSPIHPEVNEYLQAVFTELLLNYSIDGLHLDYCRFPDIEYGYNEEGLGVFRSRYGFDPRDINTLSNLAADSGLEQAQDEKLKSWNDYRRQKVTDLITALHAVITLSGKEVLLTAAVKPNPNVARHKYYQDWLQWLRNGILDYALPMNYIPDFDEYMANLTVISDSLAERMRKRVIMGVATYNQDAPATAEKIRAARLYGFKGICVFSYDVYKVNLARFGPILEVLR